MKIYEASIYVDEGDATWHTGYFTTKAKARTANSKIIREKQSHYFSLESRIDEIEVK